MNKRRRTLWSDIHDNWDTILFVIFLLVMLALVATLDHPKYYGPGNTCPTNQPTNCH